MICIINEHNNFVYEKKKVIAFFDRLPLTEHWLAVAEIAWTKSTPNSLENIKQTNQEHKCGKICYACRI